MNDIIPVVIIVLLLGTFIFAIMNLIPMWSPLIILACAGGWMYKGWYDHNYK